MYKIILTFKPKLVRDVNSLVFTYSDLEYCREQIKVLKDRYTSIGDTILELKIYKVEQIQDAEQIQDVE